MTRDDWRSYFLFLKDSYYKDKKRIITMILYAFMEMFCIYIDIIILGRIADLLFDKQNFDRFIWYTVIIFGIKYISIIIKKKSQKYFDVKLDFTKDIETKYMNEKAMSFRYENLENAEVADLRFRAMNKSYYGIEGWCLLTAKSVLQGFFSIIITIIIISDVCMENGNSSSGNAGLLFPLIIIPIALCLTIVNYKVGIYYTQKAKGEVNKAENFYNKKQYYFEKFIDMEFQKDCRINKLSSLVLGDIKDLYENLKKAEFRQGDLYIKRERYGGLLTGVNCAIVYIFVAIWAYEGAISPGNVVIVATSILQFSEHMIRLAATLGNVKSAALYAKDFFEFMRISNVSLEKGLDRNACENIESVEFKNVSFKYDNSMDYALKNVSFKYRTDEKIAIVGRNGSGKTTIIKLLCGFYDDYEGEILINGRNIKSYDMENYWEKVSAVFQDFLVLSFSLRENFFNVDDDTIIDSLKKAGMDVQDLESKVGKSVYSDGINYSGGEKQKIAIARAISKKAGIIIMDEPTAALDPIAENEIYLGFDKLVEGNGGMYISHRLSSCKFCDKIFVMDNSRLVQQGTHNQLVRINGPYKDLWMAQSECYN